MTAACQTGRSITGMQDELFGLEKELETLEAETGRSAEEREALLKQLQEMRDEYEAARVAVARRDELRAELEALGYSPDSAEAYATVAAGDGGQIRHDVAMATPEERSPAGTNPGSGERENPRPTGRYAGPHTIHRVVEGEYLGKIAGYDKYYGNPGEWPVIYEANAYQIKDPHWIFAGQLLQIPIR
jgi:nucleoid-associated protein YgaU